MVFFHILSARGPTTASIHLCILSPLVAEEAREQLPFLTGENKINKDCRAAGRGDNETPNTEGASQNGIFKF